MSSILIIVLLLIIVVTLAAVGVFYVRRIIKTQQAETSRLNAILTGIADGVIVQNMAGDIETMNPSAQRIIDIVSRETLTRKDTQQLEAQASARLASLLNYLGGLEFYETQDIEVAGRVLGTRSAPVITPDGENLGTVFVLRDITSEVEAKKLKDDFITTVSHELRTPLAVIKTFNDMLRMNPVAITEKFRPMFMNSLENVDQNILDLLNLIEQMLDLTQINAGALGIDREKLDVVQLIRNEADNWRGRMEDKELAFHMNLPEERIWVEGDENRLTRVIFHLLKNAHNYTRPGGEVELSLDITPNELQVNVKDTGVGIAERDKSFIFTRFFRAIHEESTFEISGAGLGLFLSRAIVEAHGGKIWFESETDKGSTFSFSLPLTSQF